MTKYLLAFLCAAGMLAPLAAQAGEVRHREVRQENRIYQGAKTGSLTSREYDSLQAREGRLNDLRANDLRRDDGHLTRAQDVQLNRDENHLSRTIYHDKHNGHRRP
jgi:hypothetical protein